MFAGLRSRWMMPCSCAASSASAICFAIGRASSTGIAPGDAIRQRRSLDEFHHERPHAVRFFRAVNRRDVRMIERGEDLGFTLESRQPLGIASEPRPAAP